MRIIKFRAWSIKNKSMLTEENGFHFEFGTEGITITEKGLVGGDYVLMQFTGLTDKNGKEIWEGDINADHENKKSEVVFYAGGFYLRYSETEYKAIGSFAPFNYNVIGNIYENPNLLT